jgi:F-type H+-transporting ATPase subunit a
VRGYLRRFTKPFELPVFARAVFLPLNVLEEVVKPVTLSLRLLGNIFAGGVMIGLLAAMIGFGLDQLSHGPAGGATVVLAGIGNVVWKLFDMFIGLLQALIFALLTIFYFGMAREGLEEHH